jgi:hypothetical protein
MRLSRGAPLRAVCSTLAESDGNAVTSAAATLAAMR